MKRLAIAVVLCGMAAAQAAGPAGSPPGLDVMRAALTKAAAAHDRGGVAALMAWPLALDNYGSPPALSRARFLKNGDYFAALFGDGDPALLHCIATAKPARQLDAKQFGGQAWVADCNGNEYFFAQRGGSWMLTAYQNINE